MKNGSSSKYRDQLGRSPELEVTAYEILKWVAEKGNKTALGYCLPLPQWLEVKKKIVAGKCQIQKVFSLDSGMLLLTLHDLGIKVSCKYCWLHSRVVDFQKVHT